MWCCNICIQFCLRCPDLHDGKLFSSNFFIQTEVQITRCNLKVRFLKREKFKYFSYPTGFLELGNFLIELASNSGRDCALNMNLKDKYVFSQQLE